MVKKNRFVRKAIPKKEKELVIKRDQLLCIQCNENLIIDDKYPSQLFLKNGDYHHIIPLIYKGENKACNVCLLCKPCHLKAHSGKESVDKYIEMFNLFYRCGRLF